jgi:hypothetical protein
MLYFTMYFRPQGNGGKWTLVDDSTHYEDGHFHFWKRWSDWKDKRDIMTHLRWRYGALF